MSQRARARLSPWTKAGVDFLADGPKLRTAVLAVAAAQVPPGQAIRIHHRARGNPTGLSNEYSAVVGARWMAIRNFSAMRRHGTLIETVTEEGEVFWELSESARRTLTE